MRYVVVSHQDEAVSKADAKVVNEQGHVKVLEFENDREATDFSVRVNGTLFTERWAAVENARHRATASV